MQIVRTLNRWIKALSFFAMRIFLLSFGTAGDFCIRVDTCETRPVKISQVMVLVRTRQPNGKECRKVLIVILLKRSTLLAKT